MRDYSHTVTELFQQSQACPMKEITGNNVIDAMRIAQGNCYSLDDYFRAFASLNLLNAAIKTQKWKRLLTYTFIKGYATPLWTHCIYHPLKGLEYYYNSEGNVLYFRIYGVVFSFHYVSKNRDALLFSEASKQVPIEWPGIRLQKFPVELWELAMDLSPQDRSG